MLVAIRGGEPPGDDVPIVRAGTNGLAPEVVRRAAAVSLDSFGFIGVSVFAALGQSILQLCRSVEALGRYGQIRVSTVGQLRRVGFALVPTGRAPHFTIVLPDLEDRTLAHLAACFTQPEPNPARRR